ncbi:MAG: hypothetical protein E7192_01740 [Erysipelotrichaceae bacterium]|nr:hypothetical protein [Erysipelotrichaceae bacterium]
MIIDVKSEVKGLPIYIINSDNVKININSNQLFQRIASDDIREIIQDKKYLEMIKSDALNIGGVDFKFSDKIWDFTSLCPKYDKGIKKFKLNFHDLDNKTTDYYRTLLRLYALNSMLEFSLHRPFIYSDCKIILRFFIWLCENSIYSIEELTLFDLSIYFEKFSSNISYRTLLSYKTSIKKCIIFYCNITRSSPDKEIIRYLDQRDRVKLNNQQEANKHKLLPYKFMNELVQLIIEKFDSEYDSKKKRMLGLIYLGIQTGIRPQELLIIPVNCLKYKTIGILQSASLNYLSTKGIYGNGTYAGQTFANQKMIEIIEAMKLVTPNDFEYFGEDITASIFRSFFRNLVFENRSRLGNVTDEPDSQFDGKPEQIYENGRIRYVNIPVMKQFRVYAASELGRAGYNQLTIARLMNQKDSKMIGYYGRAAAPIQDDPIYTNKVLKEILEDDLNLIGPLGNSYTERIKSYLNHEKPKAVYIDEAIKNAAKNLPIKQLLGGFCISPSPNHPCEMDNESNADKLLCAYGLCQGQHHLYYHAAYHYELFKDSVKIIMHNRKEGYLRQAEKELYKTQAIIKRFLLPELDETKRVVAILGEEEVLKKHEELSEIIRKEEEIRKDIEIWLKMTFTEIPK